MRTLTRLSIILCACAVLFMTGCNTVKGIGTDIHDMAQGSQEAIENL